jgi:hypothetical protein
LLHVVPVTDTELDAGLQRAGLIWADGGPVIDRERIGFRWAAVVIDRVGDLELHPVRLGREGSYGEAFLEQVDRVLLTRKQCDPYRLEEVQRAT